MPAARRLRVPSEVVQLVREVHPGLRLKLRAALEEVLRDPSAGEPLRDDLAGLNRLRVGRVRIVYRITARTIDIVAIGPRATIYEELRARRLRRTREEG